jgi:hypothetical protein
MMVNIFGSKSHRAWNVAMRTQRFVSKQQQRAQTERAEKQRSKARKNTCTHENSDSKQHYYSSAHFFQPVGPNCPSNIEQLILH